MNRLFIGIDIGGTNLRFALVDGRGTILRRSRCPSSIDEGRLSFCQRLDAGIAEMRGAAAEEGGHVAAIGVGVPGVIDRSGLIYSSVNMRPLDGFNLAAFLEKGHGVPVRCGNDANLIALGEHAYGAGQGLHSFVVITIGTGLGSGLILDGKLWTGARGFAAEFGHVTVVPDGHPCPCGNCGCLEQYVSASAIARLAREHLPGDLLPEADRELDAAWVAECARRGDPVAAAEFEAAGAYLGIALASLVNTLNLEAAIIGGGVAASLDLMLPSLQRELSVRCFPQMVERFSVLISRCGDDAGLLGAAALVRELNSHGE